MNLAINIAKYSHKNFFLKKNHFQKNVFFLNGVFINKLIKHEKF